MARAHAATYPVEAIGTTVLLVAAIVSNRFDRSGAPPSILAAVALFLLGLALTAKGAPIILSLGEVKSPAAPQHAFDDFCGDFILRGKVYVLAFVVAIWALSAMPAVNSFKGDGQ
jgi:hypothetical protein